MLAVALRNTRPRVQVAVARIAGFHSSSIANMPIKVVFLHFIKFMVNLSIICGDCIVLRPYFGSGKSAIII